MESSTATTTPDPASAIAALNVTVVQHLSADKKVEILKRAEEKFKQSKAAFEAQLPAPPPPVPEDFVKLDSEQSKKLKEVNSQLGVEGLVAFLKPLKLALDPSAVAKPADGKEQEFNFKDLEEKTLVTPTANRNSHSYALGMPCAYAGKQAVNPGQSSCPSSDYFFQWGSNTRLGNHLNAQLSSLRAPTMEECVAWVVMHELFVAAK